MQLTSLRYLAILLAHAVIFTLGIYGGIDLGICLAKHVSPQWLTWVSLGVAFVGQVYLSSEHACQSTLSVQEHIKINRPCGAEQNLDFGFLVEMGAQESGYAPNRLAV